MAEANNSDELRNNDEATETSEVDAVTAELHKEIDAVPAADRALLLRLVKTYREGVSDEEIDDELPSAAESFREGWRDVLAGNTHPIEDLWYQVYEST